MNKHKWFVLIALCIALGCKEKSTELSESGSPVFSYATSHCVGSGLPKTNVMSGDSIFTYSFHNDLRLDFSSYGNCCPDSNRFIVSSIIRHDTILIAVTDTSENLCRCLCLYMVHSELKGLPLNRYVVQCILADENAVRDTLHTATVIRQR